MHGQANIICEIHVYLLPSFVSVKIVNEKLNWNSKFSIPIRKLPDSNEKLSWNSKFSIPIRKLPDSNEKLNWNSKFSIPIRKLPDSNEKLNWNSKFSIPIRKLPDSNEKLNWNSKFSIPIHKLLDSKFGRDAAHHDAYRGFFHYHETKSESINSARWRSIFCKFLLSFFNYINKVPYILTAS